jgi:hypothetical protein
VAKMHSKWELFSQEYLTDLNATQAAIRSGYSPKTAVVQGSRLLTKPKVRRAVAAGMAARQVRTGITQDTVLDGLLIEARLYGDTTSHSARVAAWAHLGRHLGMFGDRDTRADQPVQITRVTIVLPTDTTSPSTTVEGGVQVVEGQGHVVEGQGHPREDESYASAS